MSRAMMICMLFVSLAVSVACSAQAPRVIAQKLCDQFDQANANHDLNQVLDLVDSSYVSTDQRGKSVAYAEWRRQMQQDFPLFRRWNPSTTVQDVQLEGDRMIAYIKTEVHFEFHDRRYGWVPEIYKGTEEDTWKRKGGQWKLVRSTVFRAERQFDPEWVKSQKSAYEKVGEICLTKHCDH